MKVTSHKSQVTSKSFLLLSFGFLLFTIFGCASMKEGTKGILGISTRVLEEGRSEAVIVNCNLGYSACYKKVKEVLRKEGSYIYADNTEKRMVAFYFSMDDTTPVGVFFVEKEGGLTQLEVTSPSSYAKQIIAEKLTAALNPIK